MSEVGQALEQLILERGLLNAAELSRLGGGARLDPVVLAGHLVAMGRVRPEQLGPLMAEAEGLAAVRAAPAPHQRLTVIDDGPPLPLPGAGQPAFVPHAAQDEPTRAAPLLRGRETVVLGEFAPPGAASTVAEEGGEPAPPVEVPSPEPAPDDGRRRVGRYVLLDELGRGAMGVVFRVSDGQQDFALKLLHTSSPGRLQRFQEELRLLLRLNHPGLVRIRDGGTDRGRPWFVMDLVRGRDLRDVLKERVRLAPVDAARVVAACARALHHAHEHGVLHRDIKPENIRVDAQLAPTIVDFGLAKDLELSSGLTHTGASIGTPYYMAPEQAAGRTHDVDVRTDVWGLGVLLYELLSGDVPFHAQSNDGLARQIIGAEPRRLRELAGDVPPALEAVCLRALAKARDGRWPDAGALADALEAALTDPRDPAPGQPRRTVLVGVATVLCAGAALSFLLPARPRPEVVAGPAPVPSAAPASDPLPEARALARAGRIEEALRLVGSDLEREVSFLRAERQALLSGPERPGLAGLRLVLAAEAGGTPRAVGRALTLLAGSPEDSPALQEARARAALLAHDPEAARFAAEAALAGSPGDPLALQIVARAEAASLTAEAGRLLDAHAAAAAGAEAPGRDPAAGALAARWEGVAARLAQARALERTAEAQDQARLWTAHAWAQALTWRRLGGEPSVGPACQAARRAALAELEPLLSLLPGERMRAARRTLARAAPAQLEQAEDQLADAVGGLGARGAAALAAALLSTRLEDPQARDRAEAWLALAGDLPAHALLALEAAARAAEPGEQQRQLRRAARLAPELPQVQAAALLFERRGAGAGRDAAALRALAQALVAAPGLALALRAPLVASPLSPRELDQVTSGLVGEDRDTQLARALARLHTAGVTPEAAALAAEDATAAVASDPGCMIAHLLRAEALLATNALSRALEALDCARAAAPGAAAPLLLGLRAQPEPPTSEALQPLLLQGWVARLPRLFLDLPLPDRLAAVLRQPELDLREARARLVLLLALEKEELSPLLAFDLRLSRILDFPRSALAPRHPLPMVAAGRPPSLDEWLGRGLVQLDELGPERWAAEAEACLREAEWRMTGDRREELHRRAIVPSIRALGRAVSAGGDPRLHPDQLRAAGVELAGAGQDSLLPDAPQLGWTWFQRLRRPDLQLARTADLLDPRPPRLTPAALAAPLGAPQALLAAVQVEEVQAEGANGLLRAGEPDEAHLALARAAAFSRAGDPARDWWELTRALAQRVLYGADEPPPGGVELLDLCLREGLQRFGDRSRDRASLQAQRTDLLLWQAGRAGAGEARRRYLEMAAAAAREIDPQQVEELAFWGPWREARLLAAQGDPEGAAAALQRARRVLNPIEVRLMTDPPRRAVLRDPLRPLLDPVPGFAELVETLTPRE